MPRDISIVLAKVETTPGTYASPVVATDAVTVFDYQITPIESELVRRSIDLPFAGARPAQRTALRARHAFSVELSGSGTATTPPVWAKLLRGAMFGAAVPNVGQVAIPLINDGDGDALSISGWKDNVRHRARMGRGNAVFSFIEKQLPSLRMDLLGLIEGGAPADANTAGAPTYTAYPAPVEVNASNTSISLDGFTLGVRSLQIDLGMKTEFFSTTGGRAIIFGKDEEGDRRSPGGTIVAELPDPSVKEYFSKLLANTPMSFALAHGTAAGNIIEIASTRVVLEDISYSVEANRLFMNAPFKFVANAANNDFSLVTK
jgi:hypothetical protein